MTTATMLTRRRLSLFQTGVVPFTDPPPEPQAFEHQWLVYTLAVAASISVLVFVTIVVSMILKPSTRKTRPGLIALAVMAVMILLFVGSTWVRSWVNDSRDGAYHEAVDEQTDTAKAALEDYYGVELTGYVQLPWSETSVQEVKVTTTDGATTDCLLHVLPDPTTDTGHRLAISCGGTDLDSATELEPAP